MRSVNLIQSFEIVQIVNNHNENLKGFLLVFSLKLVFHRCLISVDTGYRAEIYRIHK